MSTLTKYIESQASRLETEQQVLAVRYAQSLGRLQEIQRELLAQNKGVVVELRHYAGVNGSPNQPYLYIYRPYSSGGFKVLANQDGYIDVEYLGLTDFRNQIDAAMKYIARLWINL